MGRPTIRVLAGIVAAGLSASAFTTASFAADVLEPRAVEPHHRAIVGDGWYLRGDVGVSSYETDTWTQPASNNGSTIISAGFIENSLSGGAFAGGGIGYQFNSWLRADITAEYRHAVSGHGTYQEVTTFFNEFGDLVDFAGQNNYKTNLSSFVFLVNGYVDLGNWYGITPFVGGGVGVTHNWLEGTSESGYASINGGLSPVATNLVGDASKTDFAWALMAGLSYEVTPNLKLEMGYRYINLGDAKSGSIFCGTLSGCNTVAQGFAVKEIEAQEVKLGMRWILGGPVYDQPIVRKY